MASAATAAIKKGLASAGSVFLSTYQSPAHAHIGFISGEFELQPSKLVNDHPFYVMKTPYSNYPLALWYWSDAWLVGELSKHSRFFLSTRYGCEHS
jgi:hypothetical protein